MNPFETLRAIAGGGCLPRSLHVVAELGVADALKDQSMTAAELGRAVGAEPDALRRVMRLLAAHDVFEMVGDKFRHSPASQLLRSDHPQSMRGLARMFGLAPMWNAFQELDHSVRTGQPATTKTLPQGVWGFLAENPKASQVFNEAMVGKAQVEVPAIVAAYDFSPFKTIADVGGGRGHLLRAIVEATPSVKGILFDLPHVIQDAKPVASDRLSLRAGDFFKDAIPPADAYILMEVIHDWAAEESKAILAGIRRAAPAQAKLLLIEQLVPDAPGPHWSKMLDIHMLTLLGGRQRTRQEYEALLAATGFRFLREIPTRSDVSILEAAAN